MATIVGLLNRVKAFDASKAAVAVISETKETIADLNVEQMNKGLRSDGSEILPSYTALTIEIKKEKGQPTDRVTLQDTGDFYKGVYVDIEGDKIKTFSTDEKAAKLNKKYSKAKGNIFGLSNPFKREYLNEKARPNFKAKVLLGTGLLMK